MSFIYKRPWNSEVTGNIYEYGNIWALSSAVIFTGRLFGVLQIFHSSLLLERVSPYDTLVRRKM